MRYISLVLWLLIAVPCWSQTITGTAETRGPCSPAVTSSNNQITITCTGISDKLGAQLVDLLNRVAKNQIDAQEIMAKLDSCLQGTKPWKLTEDQKKQLQQSVRGMIHAKIEFRSLISDENAALMAADLDAALKDAGLNVDPQPLPVIGPQFEGITILVSHVFPDVILLRSSLTDLGIKVTGSLEPKIADDTIRIIVGNKPQPSSP